MLLIVGWSAVVVWLNVRPRAFSAGGMGGWTFFWVEHGYPCHYATAIRVDLLPDIRPENIDNHWALAANIAIGLIAVVVLTWASKYLVRAFIAALRALFGKPPPAKGKAQQRLEEKCHDHDTA